MNISKIVKEVQTKVGIRYVLKFYVSKVDFYMAMSPLPFNGVALFIDKKSARKMSKDAIRALVAHELIHRKISDERLCDAEVIKIGYGKGLLIFHKWHNKRFKKYKKSEGLTTKEVKEMLYIKKTNPN